MKKITKSDYLFEDKVKHPIHICDLPYIMTRKQKGGIRMGSYGYGNNTKEFALLVVLFILLIIVGAAYFNGGYGGGY